ncbi:calmodulin-like protein 4 [Cajanus cajan]|uniref:EF-hand domain-containing protein n=1 Tax=Cajanus cajan TaxID=3821 RepID=A0A151S7Z9_CAJCA|nr:calmodulin-like protein 4 [Cajanus cajan]KYP50909.1 hypothetical protein KK1_027268 [Cajanus cajan]
MPVRIPLPSPPHNDKPKDIPVDLLKLQKIILQKLREADSNKDGRYTRDELRTALKNLGAILPGWRANRALVNADSDNDGQIGGQEVDSLVDYLISCGYGK